MVCVFFLKKRMAFCEYLLWIWTYFLFHSSEMLYNIRWGPNFLSLESIQRYSGCLRNAGNHIVWDQSQGHVLGLTNGEAVETPAQTCSVFFHFGNPAFAVWNVSWWDSTCAAGWGLLRPRERMARTEGSRLEITELENDELALDRVCLLSCS